MTQPLAVVTLATILGAVAGSFVSTWAMRTAGGRSAITGRSACDDCGAPLAYAVTIPIWSYIRLRGRCAGCDAVIAPSHIVGEAAGAVSGAAIAAFTPPAMWAPLVLTGAALLFAAVFDARRLRIPDAVSVLVAGLGVAVAVERGHVAEALLAGLAAGVLLFAAQAAFRRVRGRDGLGLGDVKLVAALAIWTGATLTPLGLALAAGLALLMTSRRHAPSSARVAFGPYLAAAFWPLLIGGVAR